MNRLIERLKTETLLMRYAGFTLGANIRLRRTRITDELNIEYKRTSRPRVARLMKKAGIRSKMAKKYRVSTTDSKHGFRIASNLLDRNFTSTGSAHRKVGETGKVWVSDITYIPTV